MSYHFKVQQLGLLLNVTNLFLFYLESIDKFLDLEEGGLNSTTPTYEI